MPSLLVFVLAGLFGQLVDGSVGMGFGVTSSTVLISSGVTPAASSAGIHLAKLGTALTSGASHWRFGNVSWPLVAGIAVPGAAGAFAGATVLGSLTASWLVPAVAAVLFCMGVVVIVRSVRGRAQGGTRPASTLRARLLAPVGLSGGFLDAVGGGGWGPVAVPALLTMGRVEPRFVIGSANTAEFFVALAACAGFFLGPGGEGIGASSVLALMAGGIVAAPVAAWVVRRADASVLGVVVGTLLLATNAWTLLLEAGVWAPVRVPVLVAIAAVGLVVTLRVRRLRSVEPPAQAPAPSPEPPAAEPGGAGDLAPEIA